MATNDSIHRMRRLHVTFAELKAALLEADINERRLEPHMVPWPADIGFVIGPSNEWLAEVIHSMPDDGQLDDNSFGNRDFKTVSPELRARVMVLVRDQQRLLTGWRPSMVDLSTAPVITPDTVFVTHQGIISVINLVGHVRNVPDGGPDRRRITSPVAAFDADRFAWVRTLSRFYRLDRGQSGSRPNSWPTDGEASSGNNSVDGDER
jgi:hypothetical protein